MRPPGSETFVAMLAFAFSSMAVCGHGVQFHHRHTRHCKQSEVQCLAQGHISRWTRKQEFESRVGVYKLKMEAPPSCFSSQTSCFVFCVCPAVASFHSDCLVCPAFILCVFVPPPSRTPQTAHPTPPRNWRARCSRWTPPLFHRDTSAYWATATTFMTLTGSRTTTCWTR